MKDRGCFGKMNRGGRPKFQLVHSIWDNDEDEDD